MFGKEMRLSKIRGETAHTFTVTREIFIHTYLENIQTNSERSPYWRLIRFWYILTGHNCLEQHRHNAATLCGFTVRYN